MRLCFAATKWIPRCEPKKWHALRSEPTPDFMLVGLNQTTELTFDQSLLLYCLKMPSILILPCIAHCTLFIRAGNFWWVCNEKRVQGQYPSSWLRAKVVTEQDELIPPLQGWQHIRSGKWESDPTFECSREVSPACSEIIVELQGKAKEKHPFCAGSYLPVDGKMNRGRWVGSLYLQHSFPCK